MPLKTRQLPKQLKKQRVEEVERRAIEAAKEHVAIVEARMATEREEIRLATIVEATTKEAIARMAKMLKRGAMAEAVRLHAERGQGKG